MNTSQVAPTVSAFYRVFFGSLFIIVACFVKGEFKVKGWKQNSQAILCGVFFAFDLLTWHFAIKYVGPGLATILGNFQVFILAFFGILFLKEKTGAVFYLSVPIAIFGLFLLIGVDAEQLSSDYLTGVGFGLATACFYAMFILCLRNLQGKDEHPPLFYYQMILLIACSIFLAGSVVVSGESFIIPTSTSLASLLGLGFVSQTIGWVMISFSLPGIKASHAGLILLIQPSLSFVWDFLFFSRPTGTVGWIGLLLVLIAIYMSVFRKEKPVSSNPGPIRSN